MESQKFNLCWNEFDKAASTMLKNLVSDQHFTDVTISCDSDQTIQVCMRINVDLILPVEPFVQTECTQTVYNNCSKMFYFVDNLYE